MRGLLQPVQQAQPALTRLLSMPKTLAASPCRTQHLVASGSPAKPAHAAPAPKTSSLPPLSANIEHATMKPLMSGSQPHLWQPHKALHRLLQSVTQAQGCELSQAGQGGGAALL